MITYAIRYTGPQPGSDQFKESDFRALLTNAWREVGLYWHRHYRPKHFTREGAREYGYPAASPSRRYEFVKLRVMGEQPALYNLGRTRPLVYSGESERSSAIQDIRPSAGGVRVALRGKGISFHADRIAAVSEAEIKTLEGVLQKNIDDQLAAVAGSQTKEP